MAKIAKMGVLVLLVLAFSLGAFTPASAGRPFCNIDTQTKTMFQGNVYSVSWTGSPNVERAFVVWPLDDRDHWAAYELWLTDESFEKTGLHEGAVFVDLAEGRWTRGQLIVILTDNSPQPRHHPTQEPPMDHGRLLVLLGLVAPRGGEVPPQGAPLCKIYLDPVRIEPIP